MDLPRAFSSVPIICAAGSDFWSVCSLCVNMLREASRPLISSEMFQLQLSTQNGCNGFPFSTFIHKEWHMKKVDRCMQAICISFYSEEPDSSCKSSSEPGFSSGSSESGVSSWRTTLNPNADPGANADSISPSDWVVWISGFTFRFSWFISSKSVSYLPVTGFFFAKCYLNWHSPSWQILQWWCSVFPEERIWWPGSCQASAAGCCWVSEGHKQHNLCSVGSEGVQSTNWKIVQCRLDIAGTCGWNLVVNSCVYSCLIKPTVFFSIGKGHHIY